MKLVGVCACTSGIAHTYMAKEKLVKAAQALEGGAAVAARGRDNRVRELAAPYLGGLVSEVHEDFPGEVVPVGLALVAWLARGDAARDAVDRLVFEAPLERLEPAWNGHAVGVDEGDRTPAACAPANVAAARRRAPRVVNDRRTVGARNVTSGVAAAPVGDYDLERDHAARKQRVDALAD